MLVKLDHLPEVWGENTITFELPPASTVHFVAGLDIETSRYIVRFSVNLHARKLYLEGFPGNIFVSPI